MIDLRATNEWQWVDPSCNLVFPWYTRGALDEISTWDLSEKRVLEYGGGASTLWWERKARRVVTIETNSDYLKAIDHEIMGDHGVWNDRLSLIHAPVNEGDQKMIHEYVDAADRYHEKYDIVVVDGILRYECMQKALTLPRPLTLIVDNWQQDYVFICPAAEELMKDYKGTFYIQPDHTNHEGHPWTTAIWHLP